MRVAPLPTRQEAPSDASGLRPAVAHRWRARATRRQLLRLARSGQRRYGGWYRRQFSSSSSSDSLRGGTSALMVLMRCDWIFVAAFLMGVLTSLLNPPACALSRKGQRFPSFLLADCMRISPRSAPAWIAWLFSQAVMMPPT